MEKIEQYKKLIRAEKTSVAHYSRMLQENPSDKIAKDRLRVSAQMLSFFSQKAEEIQKIDRQIFFLTKRIQVIKKIMADPRIVDKHPYQKALLETRHDRALLRKRKRLY